MLMRIEVSANSRPGKPALAVILSAALLVLTLGGAWWLTAARSQPVSLQDPQPVRALPGVKIRWPDGWQTVNLTRAPGPLVTTVGDVDDRRIRGIMGLLYRDFGEPVHPQRVALHMLQAVQQQLGMGRAPGQIALASGTMIDLPAIQIRTPVFWQEQVWWLQIRIAVDTDGRAHGLMLLTPQQIGPAEDRLLDAVTESLQVPKRGPAEYAPDEDVPAGPVHPSSGDGLPV